MKEVTNPQELIRVEFQAMRTAFHSLVDSMTEIDWKSRSNDTAWTNGEVMMHITDMLAYLPSEVNSVRRAKNFLNFPASLINFINYYLIRIKARNIDRKSIKAKYDLAYENALRVLTGIRNDEWQRGVEFYGGGYHNIEELFRLHPHHLEEHALHIRQSLGHK
jgi:hypothetical protein